MRSTFSKHPSRFPQGYPQEIYSGKGAYVRSFHTFLDWAMGLGGAGVFGHADLADVTGMAYHLPHPLEVGVATQLCNMLPDYAEDVRFVVNGTDATNGAVRLARAVTGREGIVMFKGAYHGASADWCCPPPARGVIRNKGVQHLEWNNAGLLTGFFDSIDYAISERMGPAELPAAVIFEVGPEDPTPDFVAALNRVHEYGALLIADEVVTGFRLALGGACEKYGIKPDLACFGKALGNGYPIAAIVGKREYMKEFDLLHTLSPVFCSYTHAGNAACLSAANAVLNRMNQDVIDHLYDVGDAISRAFKGTVVGQPPRHGFRFNTREEQYAFWQLMAKRKVLMYTTNFPSTAHGDAEVEMTIEAIEWAQDQMSRGYELEGPLPKPLYSPRT